MNMLDNPIPSHHTAKISHIHATKYSMIMDEKRGQLNILLTK